MSKGNEKILIIDDDDRNVFALSLVLRSRGYTCVSTQEAAEGLALLSTQMDIGVVLMDMMMPEMDGYTMIPRIREMPDVKSIPIIAITAQAMPGDKERCIAAGANDYLSKPVDVDQLLYLLHKYLK